MTKSKFRIASIMLIFTMLFGLGFQPYELFLVKKSFEPDVSHITAGLLLIILIFGIAIILRRTVFVKFDETNSEITFIYLFRKYVYSLEDIEGFRFIYLKGRVDFKGLEVKSNNGKKHVFRDFGTKNLREFERLFVQNFDLRSGVAFQILNENGKNKELKTSAKFDKKQEADIRIWLYLAIGISFLFLIISSYYNRSLNIGFIAIASFLIMIIIISSRRLMKINKSRPWHTSE